MSVTQLRTEHAHMHVCWRVEGAACEQRHSRTARRHGFRRQLLRAAADVTCHD